MAMSLENHIKDIQAKLKNEDYSNEQAIRQGVVLRILDALDWPVHDTQLVSPEFSVPDGRVDYALCSHPKKAVVFIEVKQVGNILGADQQLFNYAYHTGVQSAIVTDGKEWHFYLPAEVGNYDERRVYKLDLVERDIEESAYRLIRYLEFKNVIDGLALESAREDYKNISKERQAKNNIPIAWEKLLDEKDDLLFEVISDKVESICGFKPTENQIYDYLKSIQIRLAVPQKTRTQKIDRSRTRSKSSNTQRKSKYAKIRVVFPDSTEICMTKVADTMVEVIRRIGFDKVKSLDLKMYGFPIVSKKEHNKEKYNWSDAGNGIYVFTHSNTDKKLSQLNEINDALRLGLFIEKIK